jgi:hypothetical protein
MIAPLHKSPFQDVTTGVTLFAVGCHRYLTIYLWRYLGSKSDQIIALPRNIDVLLHVGPKSTLELIFTLCYVSEIECAAL